eukprot:8553565-Pyramimonas_sp.AAC.1
MTTKAASVSAVSPSRRKPFQKAPAPSPPPASRRAWRAADSRLQRRVAARAARPRYALAASRRRPP